MDQATFLLLVRFSAVLAGLFVMFNLCCFYIHPAVRRLFNRVLYPFIPYREAREFLSVAITATILALFVFAMIDRLGV